MKVGTDKLSRYNHPDEQARSYVIPRPVAVRINMPDGSKLTIELPTGETADNVMRAALQAFGRIGERI